MNIVCRLAEATEKSRAYCIYTDLYALVVMPWVCLLRILGLPMSGSVWNCGRSLVLWVPGISGSIGNAILGEYFPEREYNLLNPKRTRKRPKFQPCSKVLCSFNILDVPAWKLIRPFRRYIHTGQFTGEYFCRIGNDSWCHLFFYLIVCITKPIWVRFPIGCVLQSHVKFLSGRVATGQGQSSGTAIPGLFHSGVHCRRTLRTKTSGH